MKICVNLYIFLFQRRQKEFNLVRIDDRILYLNNFFGKNTSAQFWTMNVFEIIFFWIERSVKSKLYFF